MTSRETTILRAIAKAIRSSDESEMFTFAILYLPYPALGSGKLAIAALLLDFVASGSVD